MTTQTGVTTGFSGCRIYGIKNCSTMKKAFAWLDERAITYDFHDYKKADIASTKLHAWCNVLGWRTLLNTRGTTWRRLTPEQQNIETQGAAVQLMAAHPSLIRRPLVETPSGHLLVGFDPATFSSFIQAQDHTG